MWVLLLSALGFAGQEGVWESRAKTGGKEVVADIVVDPTEPSRWFGLDDGHLYASYDSGNGWRAIAFDVDGVPGDGSAAEAGLAFDPASPGVLYGRFNGKSRRSVDGGVTWSDDASRIEWVDGRWEVLHDVAWAPPERARAYARDPSNRDVVYAATPSGVFASGDGGKTWEARNAWLEEVDVRDLRVDPANTQKLVALTAHNLFRSTNGGRMWAKSAAEPYSRGVGEFRRLVHDDGARVVAWYSHHGLLVALEAGAWVPSKIGCTDLSSLGADDAVCANPGTLVRGSPATLTFTTALRAGFKKPTVLRLRQTPKGPVIATLDGGGALVSPDGRSWEVYGGLEQGYVEDIAEDPSGSGVLFRAAAGLHMYKNAAEGWIERVKDRGASAVLFDPAMPTRVYTASSSGKVQRSDDLGWTFQDASTGLPGSPIRDLLIDSSGVGVLWAATWGDGVYRSADGGKTWAAAGQSERATYVRRLALDPANPDTVWAAALSAGLWRTTDAGVSWSFMKTGCHVINAVGVHPLQSEKVAVGCEDGKVVRTEDGGGTWLAPVKVSEADVRSILYTQPDGKLVVGTAGAEVVWVSEGGDVVTNDRFANMKVTRVSFQADLQRGAIYGPEGMFLTRDGGKRWEAIGLEGKKVTGMAVNPGEVVAWVVGEGLMVRTDERARWDRKRQPSVRNSGIGKDDVDCTAPLPLEADVEVMTAGSNVLLVEHGAENRREWWGTIDGSWQVRGKLVCVSPTGPNTNELMGIPTARNTNWAFVARWIGLDRPAKLDKAAEKAGMEVRENLEIADGRTFVVTTEGETLFWNGDTFQDAGALPGDAHSYHLNATEVKPRVVLIIVGTEHGVRVSRDFGKTYQEL